jgi:hypothetical protein
MGNSEPDHQPTARPATVPTDRPADRPTTQHADYTQRLQRLEQARWKRLLDVQAPYRWNVRRLCPAGCSTWGAGSGAPGPLRLTAPWGSTTTPHSVAVARERGCTAFTPDDWPRAGSSAEPASYDTLLAAHLLEHLARGEAPRCSLLPAAVRPGGRVVLVTPQELGWRSDATARALGRADRAAPDRPGARAAGRHAAVVPFRAPAGRVFRYNEFVQVSTVPASARVRYYGLALVASFGTCLLILELLRRGQLREKYAALWLLIGAAVVVVGLAPGLLFP